MPDQEPYTQHGMDRQIYKDKTIEEAVALQCDVVQLKYDGWWSLIKVAQGKIEFFSRTGRLFKTLDYHDRELDCVLVGEHMQGTQWAQDPLRLGRTFIFDAWKFGDMHLSNLTYRERYRVANMLLKQLPETFELVFNYSINRAHTIWDTHVNNDGEFEGLVFRKSTDIVPVVLYRHKKTVTEDYTCLGFVEGVGKFQGTLGSLLLGDKEFNPILTDSGEHATASGGLMTDEDRIDVWNNQPFYFHKSFECEGRARFKSGCLRHPNFIRWRLDKLEP